MAVYKVIQDIEAEDHILGPLSLRQFIFGLIAVACFYFTYLVSTKGVGFLSVIFVPPGLFAAFFAIPFGRDQPTEIWALAKIRYFIKPRRRIWDQSGVKELVTVTAPKKVEESRTNGLSEVEVRSRLSALANTIDTRGWAIKNINVNLYAQPLQQMAPVASDRLVDMSSVPQQVPDYDVQASDDILDERNNPIAQQFDQMISSSAQAHHQQLQAMMNAPAPPPPAPAAPVQQQTSTQPTSQPDYWFMHEPVQPPKLGNDQAMFAPQVLMPGTDDTTTSPLVPHAADPTAEEAALVSLLKQEQPNDAFGRMKTILPLDQQRPAPPPVAAPITPIPPQQNPAVQKLVRNNDLNIDVIAREAKRTNNPKHESGDGEVVISLH